MLDAARRLFLDNGYAATTLASIAAEASVSVETIYKAFGGKAGLVRAIADRALGGAGPVHAETRSDRLQATEVDPRAIVRGWGELMKEVSPRVSPILLLVGAAAATDAEMAELSRTISAERLRRMTANARNLGRDGHLRDGVSVERAAEVMWTYTAPELYGLLVLERGWSVDDYVAFAVDALAASLLRPKRRRSG